MTTFVLDVILIDESISRIKRVTNNNTRRSQSLSAACFSFKGAFSPFYQYVLLIQDAVTGDGIEKVGVAGGVGVVDVAFGFVAEPYVGGGWEGEVEGGEVGG